MVTPEMGPYYAPGDYAGLFRRFLIIAVDLTVLGLGGLLAFLVDPLVGTNIAALGWLGFGYVYLVVLEASPLGTLGFFVTGVKITTLKGERPSFIRMTFRLLLWILGPVNVLVDLWWLTGDDFKQTLRDKCAGTIVIRKNALPLGSGEITLKRYQMLAHSFVFYEVQKPAAPAEVRES